ncbi:hypothetical protein EIP91_004255 [Steccherinum ochraceum]|uniref:Protein kinase domain-containing protein n=1 Tax=Steccherinum ochraceum TaxID=92696 RepID=A0A4R0RKI6_9APHY|nr:hypothetical protein EIP91_004255 [Steccherinum ochraceum]
MATHDSDPWDSGHHIADDYWRSRYYLLAVRGYTLRDHFRPDKQPSQRNPPRPWPPNDVPDGIDARMPGGKLVLVRRLATDSQELSLLLKFSQPKMRSAPGNLCVPVLDTFEDPQNTSVTFVVTPFLFDPIQLSWRNVDDIMNYITRILEGLVFFHANDISDVLSSTNNVYSVVGFDASSILEAEGGNWNAVNPLGMLERPTATFFGNYIYYMRDTVPFYIVHLHYCKVETSVQGPNPSPLPAYRLAEHGNLPAQDPSSLAATRMTQGMKSDLRNLNRVVIGEQRGRVVENPTALGFLQELTDELGSSDPPDAVTALRRFRELHYSRSWLLRKLWPVQ